MFILPQFNLAVHIWRHAHDPAVDPPDVVTVGNLAWGRRVNVPSTGGTGALGVPLMTLTLLLPPLTDVRGDSTGAAADWVEAPAGTGRVYLCYFVDDLGKGFANEHRGAVLGHGPTWPVPTP